MTKKINSGTLSTKKSADKKKATTAKEANVDKKMKELLGLNKIRFSAHANQRMGERNVIDYEVRQALHNGKHDPSNDRYSTDWENWKYSIEGKTQDQRHLRIGISFETTEKGERLLLITVIEPNK